MVKDNLYDFVVIGSGPGGAVSAKVIQDFNFNSCMYIASPIFSNVGSGVG